PTANADEYLKEIAAASSLDALEQVRVKLLGRSGSISLLMRGLGQVPPEQRRDVGAKLNALKDEVGHHLEERKAALSEAPLHRQLAAGGADAPLPVTPPPTGRIHPISQTIDEIVAIFGEMGFVVAEGPHIEEDFYNFTALNIPPEHPARQEHDTFYLPERTDGSRLVLRTHTSPVQIRTMQKQK